MTSKERTLLAAKRQKVDRPPTSLRCTPEMWAKLTAHFDVQTPTQVLDKLDVDMRQIYLPFTGPKELSTPTLGGEGKDFWGNTMAGISNEFNTYFEIVGHSLGECKTASDIRNFKWPSLDWWDYKAIPKIIEEHQQTGERAVMFLVGGCFETPWYMRGMEQFFMDLLTEPEIVYEICTHVREYYYERGMRVINEAHGAIDMIGSGGDLGGEETLMVRPELWREHIKPHTKKLITNFKEMGFTTWYHSDGSIVPVINDFIEMGLDYLDPIQTGAAGMDPENMADKFADRLSFHGAIDEVGLLPHATPDEVYEETQRVISVLGVNHGYCVSPTHMVQGDTSVENVLAIYKAAKDYKY